MLRTALCLIALLPVAPAVAVPSFDEAKTVCLGAQVNEPDGAIEACTGLIQSGWGSAQDRSVVFFSRGEARSGKGEYELAILDYDEAIRLDPASVAAYRAKGHAWSLLGDFERALAEFSAVIRLTPSDPEGFELRGGIHERKGDLENAMADYGQMIILRPTDGSGYFYRANAFRLQGEYARAIKDLDQAIRLNPVSSEALSLRGRVFLVTGNLDGAIADLDRSVPLSPWNPNGFADRCVARWRLGLHAAAFADCAAAQRLLAPFPVPNAWPWTAEAGLHLLSGNLPAAQSALNEALRRAPDDALSLGLRSELSQRRSEGVAAKTDLDAARAKDASVQSRLEMLFGRELLTSGAAGPQL